MCFPSKIKDNLLTNLITNRSQPTTHPKSKGQNNLKISLKFVFWITEMTVEYDLFVDKL